MTKANRLAVWQSIENRLRMLHVLWQSVATHSGDDLPTTLSISLYGLCLNNEAVRVAIGLRLSLLISAAIVNVTAGIWLTLMITTTSFANCITGNPFVIMQSMI